MLKIIKDWHIEIYLLLILTSLIFFIKNPLIHWLEGDFENIYFIYNTILTGNSITPNPIDYPGNSSFSINSIYLKIISLFDKTLIINLDDIIKSTNPTQNFNKIFKYLKFLQLFYFFITLVFFYKILRYFNLNNKVAFSLTLLFLISQESLDNIQRYRFDFESLTFYIISTFFLIYSLKTKQKGKFIFISSFFLCMSIFSKIIILPLFLSIPMVIYFKKKNEILFFIKDFFLDKKLIIIFFIINFLMMLFSIFYKYNLIVIISNNLIYLGFFFFYSRYFENLSDKKNNIYLLIWILGILFGLIFMYSQALNFQKILFVSTPYLILENHFTSISNFSLVDIKLIFEKIKFNFLEISLLITSIYLIIFKKKNISYADIYLFIIYFLYKIILSSKGSPYLNIFPLFALFMLLSLNLKEIKNNFIVYAFVLLNVVLNFNTITNNDFNQRIDNNEICILKQYKKEDYMTLDRNNFFLLYYAPKFSDYDFIKKLC